MQDMVWHQDTDLGQEPNEYNLYNGRESLNDGWNAPSPFTIDVDRAISVSSPSNASQAL